MVGVVLEGAYDVLQGPSLLQWLALKNQGSCSALAREMTFVLQSHGVVARAYAFATTSLYPWLGTVIRYWGNLGSRSILRRMR